MESDWLTAMLGDLKRMGFQDGAEFDLSRADARALVTAFERLSAERDAATLERLAAVRGEIGVFAAHLHSIEGHFRTGSGGWMVCEWLPCQRIRAAVALLEVPK